MRGVECRTAEGIEKPTRENGAGLRAELYGEDKAPRYWQWRQGMWSRATGSKPVTA